MVISQLLLLIQMATIEYIRAAPALLSELDSKVLCVKPARLRYNTTELVIPVSDDNTTDDQYWYKSDPSDSERVCLPEAGANFD